MTGCREVVVGDGRPSPCATAGARRSAASQKVDAGCARIARCLAAGSASARVATVRRQPRCCSERERARRVVLHRCSTRRRRVRAATKLGSPRPRKLPRSMASNVEVGLADQGARSDSPVSVATAARALRNKARGELSVAGQQLRLAADAERLGAPRAPGRLLGRWPGSSSASALLRDRPGTSPSGAWPATSRTTPCRQPVPGSKDPASMIAAQRWASRGLAGQHG